MTSRVSPTWGQNRDPATNEPAVSDQDPPTAGSNVKPPITPYLGGLCKSWTLDWTGLWTGPWTGPWTAIWTKF